MRLTKHLPLVLLTTALALTLIFSFLYQPPEYDPNDVSGSGMPPLPGWASEPLPDFRKFKLVDEKKEAFFEYLYPRVRVANSRVLIARNFLDQLADREQLSAAEEHWIKQQAKRLRLDPQSQPAVLIEQLQSRLDIVPPSLVLAQAANESAWGASRFARKGNNLFGQWCFSAGCGLVPSARAKGAGHEVQVFRTPYHSVRSYVQNLNRHRSYKSLRQLRLNKRSAGELPDGITLVRGLGAYSERGEDYIFEISSMIRINDLQRYDERFRKQVQSHPLHRLATAKEPELDPTADQATAE